MSISNRETVLVWITLAVLLGGATFLLGSNKMQEWKDIGEARENIEKEIVLNQRLVDQREAWASRLEDSLQYIQAFGPEIKVTPKLLESIEQVARSNSLRLESLSPDDERSLGDLYELGIKCTWQGDLEALVRFLYALKTEGGKYKMRSLSIAPTGSGGTLKGTFTVDCAYTRTGGEADAGLTVTPAETPR